MPIGEITVNPALNFNPLNYMQQGAQLRSQNLSNQAAQTNLQTLGAMNNARLNYLDQLNSGQALTNQKMQLLMQYVQPQAAAQLGQTQAQTGLIGAQTNLTGQQAQYFPVTAWGQMLNGLGRFGMAYSPGAILKYFPKDLQEPMARALVNGNSSFGNVSLPNTSSLFGSALNLLPGMGSNGSGGTPISGGLPPNNGGNPLSNNSTAGGAGVPYRMVNSPLPMQPSQISRLAQLFGGAQGNSALANGPSANNNTPPWSPNPVPQSAVDQYNAVSQAAQQNLSGSPQLQQKYNYAKNLMSTITQYGNPAVTFAKYMGPQGWARYQADSVANRNDPTYINFTSFRNKLMGLSGDQLRQFLSASVRPTAMAALHEIINPESVRVGAAGAAKGWDDFYNALHQEGNTAAQTVGRTSEFNNLYPALGPQNILNNMRGLKQAGENPNVYFSTYNPSMQASVKKLFGGQ